MSDLSHVQLRSLLPVANDSRRLIRECNFSTMSVQSIEVSDGAVPLGQHYHANKSELFVILEGGGTIRTVRVNSSGVPEGIVAERAVIVGDVISVPPYYAHRFDLRKDTRMLVFSSKPFEETDIIRCPIDI